MKRKQALAKAKEELDKQPKVWSRNEIFQLFDTNRKRWGFPSGVGPTRFLSDLLEDGHLTEHRLDFPHRPFVRYSSGGVSIFEVLQAINEKGYFSHLTAMQLHSLTEQIPKTIYFNVEQKLTGGGGTPTQEGIDRAFKAKCRVSKNVVATDEYNVRMLNGRSTSRLGVTNMEVTTGRFVSVTDLERTLIDIVVRPVYAGGLFLVANAYKRAKGRLLIPRLVKYLKMLDFTYPYHQSIGYLLERKGGYSSDQLEGLKNLGLEFDFYLDYAMRSTRYIEEWRLIVPKDF